MRSSTVVVLAVLWSVVLLPGVIRDRKMSPASTVDTFANAMGRLASSDVRRVMVPGGGARMMIYPRMSRREEMLERRRSLLLRLIGSLGVMTLVALLFGGWAWALPVLAAVALCLYVAALRTIAVQAQRAKAVVPLHPVRAATRGGATARSSTPATAGVGPAAPGPAAAEPAPTRVAAGGGAEPLFG